MLYFIHAVRAMGMAGHLISTNLYFDIHVLPIMWCNFAAILVLTMHC